MTATMKITTRSEYPILYDPGLGDRQPGEAHLVTHDGKPWGLTYLCPCGQRDPQDRAAISLIRFTDGGGPHTLRGEDPLTVSPSIGAAYPCGTPPKHRCHFYIVRGAIDWCPPLAPKEG